MVNRECSGVWGGDTGIERMEKIEKMQERYMRWMLRIDGKTPEYGERRRENGKDEDKIR